MENIDFVNISAGIGTIILGIVATIFKSKYDKIKELGKKIVEYYDDDTLSPEEFKDLVERFRELI